MRRSHSELAIPATPSAHPAVAWNATQAVHGRPQHARKTDAHIHIHIHNKAVRKKCPATGTREGGQAQPERREGEPWEKIATRGHEEASLI